MNQERRLLAVDPSLRSTGWAIFDVGDPRPLSWGVIQSTNAKLLLADRLNTLHHAIDALFKEHALTANDFLVCEGPAPLVLNPQSALKVEHVRGIFETIARMRGVAVPGRVNPRTVQTEILGMRGKQLGRSDVKAWARESVYRLYGELLPPSRVSQDVIDALLIGTLAVSKIRLALQAGVECPVMFATTTAGSQSWRAFARS